MLNEKFRERIDAWQVMAHLRLSYAFLANSAPLSQCFVKKPEKFAGFMHRVLELSLDENTLSNAEQFAIVTFLVNSFNSVVSFDVFSAIFPGYFYKPLFLGGGHCSRTDE